MKEIREWLEKDGTYATGLALYETHGKSGVVLKSLRYGETAFTRATLRRELGKLAAATPEKVETSHQKVETPRQKVETSHQKVVSSPAKEPSSPPTETKPAEHPQRRDWYAQRAYAHAQLELVATDAERRALAETILALSENITASYQADVPAEAEPAAELAALTDEGSIRRQLANLRPQRSKLKKNPNRAGDLARVEAAINLLEQKLKRDGESQLHPRHRNGA